MKYIYIVFFVLITFSSYKSYAQDIPKEKLESKRLMTLYNKLEGTYQLQIIDSREKPTLPLTIMDSIETKRQQNTTIYFWLKTNVRVMVPAYSVINKQGFTPLESIKYISSSEK